MNVYFVVRIDGDELYFWRGVGTDFTPFADLAAPLPVEHANEAANCLGCDTIALETLLEA